MKIENVKVSLNEETFAVACLSWEADGFRYHVWTHTPETLYKNPPEGAEYGKPETGYFNTRKLDANAHVNAQMISEAHAIAAVRGAVGKAKDALLQKKAAKDEANRIAYAKHCKREAAEEMYDALKEFVDAAQSWHDFHKHDSGIQCDQLCAAIGPGRAAIAKADGLTPTDRGAEKAEEERMHQGHA
jgi:hypothetical protein